MGRFRSYNLIRHSVLPLLNESSQVLHHLRIMSSLCPLGNCVFFVCWRFVKYSRHKLWKIKYIVFEVHFNDGLPRLKDLELRGRAKVIIIIPNV